MNQTMKTPKTTKKSCNLKTELEVKFPVKDIVNFLETINKRGIGKLKKTEYIRDIIFGCKGKNKKIRLRIQNNFKNTSIEIIYKYKINCIDNTKTEIEETIYHGNKIEDVRKTIRCCGDFKEENSYEKIRATYLGGETEITLDIYPYGVWVEIEGAPKKIWSMAKKLGYRKSQAITKNADELYLDWNKKYRPKEFWDVRFGFTGKK